MIPAQGANLSRKDFAQLHIVYHKILLTVTHDLVTSRMDYSNALSMGLP